MISNSEIPYFFENVYALKDAKLMRLDVLDDEGILKVKGVAFKEEQIINFSSTCMNSEDVFMIKSLIQPLNKEEYNTVDTFYFEADNIRIVSNDPFQEQSIERNIAYESAHRR